MYKAKRLFSKSTSAKKRNGPPKCQPRPFYSQGQIWPSFSHPPAEPTHLPLSYSISQGTLYHQCTPQLYTMKLKVSQPRYAMSGLKAKTTSSIWSALTCSLSKLPSPCSKFNCGSALPVAGCHKRIPIQLVHKTMSKVAILATMKMST